MDESERHERATGLFATTLSLPADERLLEQPKGSMCNYIVRVTDVKEVDDQLFAWVKSAFESAG